MAIPMPSELLCGVENKGELAGRRECYLRSGGVAYVLINGF